MANANPVDSGSKSDNKPAKRQGTEKNPVEIKSWTEMMDSETGKKMKGSFKMGDTVITNS